jgi:hypothetical protein
VFFIINIVCFVFVIFMVRFTLYRFTSIALSDAEMPNGAWSGLASCIAINTRMSIDSIVMIKLFLMNRFFSKKLQKDLSKIELTNVVSMPQNALARLFTSMHENKKV